MNFKVSKGQVINQAQIAVYNAVHNQLYILKNNQYNNTAADTIGDMIIFAIDAAVVSMVNNIYTDEEFEEDIQLRDKV